MKSGEREKETEIERDEDIAVEFIYFIFSCFCFQMSGREQRCLFCNKDDHVILGLALLLIKLSPLFYIPTSCSISNINNGLGSKLLCTIIFIEYMRFSTFSHTLFVIWSMTIIYKHDIFFESIIDFTYETKLVNFYLGHCES